MTLNYPAQVLTDGKATIKWTKELSRQEIHAVIQDKDIPVVLLPELTKNIPAKFLHNLACHKKLQPELRITVLRRIFRANPSELKNQAKIDIYKNILKLQWWSEKDHQITRSYIQEVTKLSKDPQPVSKKVKAKKKGKTKVAAKVVKPTILRLPPRPLPDSTITDIAKYLDYHRAKSLWKTRSELADMQYCKILACSMMENAVSAFPSLASSAVPSLSLEDLLSFRIELNKGLHRSVSSDEMQDLLNGYKLKMRGEYASTFLTHVDANRDKHEVLYELLTKACSHSEEDYQLKIYGLESTASTYEQHLEKLLPSLKEGKVEVTQGGMATITFSASINLEFNETAFKYWKSSEDESYGFPVRFTMEFDRKTKLNICTVTITKLLPGQAYKFAITATAKEQKFRLELGEFEVPQVPYVSTQGVNTYFGSVSHGAPVPIGGGGERRWMQF
jgi:hypothetical protein